MHIVETQIHDKTTGRKYTRKEFYFDPDNLP